MAIGRRLQRRTCSALAGDDGQRSASQWPIARRPDWGQTRTEDVEVIEAKSEANPYRRTLLRQERSLKTRRSIMRAASALWAERGYNETTVEDVCNAAGVGRSTYYLHFESKDRLLIEFALATAGGVSADVELAVRGGTFEDELAAFVDGLVSRMEHTPRGLVVTVMRQVALNSVAAREWGRDEILFDDVLTRIVRDGQTQGRVRSDVVPEDVGEVISGMVLDALQRWASGDTDRTLREGLELRLDLVFRGIARAVD
jgi:AcrR family transcriptional regulator